MHLPCTQYEDWTISPKRQKLHHLRRNASPPQSQGDIIIIIMSLRLSARWRQLFTGLDFSMPADLAQGGTGHVHCADTILLCHPAILCMDAPFEIFRPFYQILDVLLVYNRPFCRCGQITLVSSA